MSTPTAKDLLAQADRLMRQRTPEELPVLTDLVIEEIELPSPSNRNDDVDLSPPPMRPQQTLAPTAKPPATSPERLLPMPALAALDGPNTQTAIASVREKFNEQLMARMEELQHSVFSQVMQKLEIHAAGSLKTHLRETLEPSLLGIARDLAEQVAEDTASRVRQVVSDAVDAEISRLREQFSKKRF